MLLDGEKSLERLFFTPKTISESIIAESIEPVMPHLLNPAAV